jgi:hypothetical protein
MNDVVVNLYTRMYKCRENGNKNSYYTTTTLSKFILIL